jgi:hypothetical protein
VDLRKGGFDIVMNYTVQHEKCQLSSVVSQSLSICDFKFLQIFVDLFFCIQFVPCMRWLATHSSSVHPCPHPFYKLVQKKKDISGYFMDSLNQRPPAIGRTYYMNRGGCLRFWCTLPLLLNSSS